MFVFWFTFIFLLIFYVGLLAALYVALLGSFPWTRK